MLVQYTINIGKLISDSQYWSDKQPILWNWYLLIQPIPMKWISDSQCWSNIHPISWNKIRLPILVRYWTYVVKWISDPQCWFNIQSISGNRYQIPNIGPIYNQYRETDIRFPIFVRYTSAYWEGCGLCLWRPNSFQFPKNSLIVGEIIDPGWQQEVCVVHSRIKPGYVFSVTCMMGVNWLKITCFTP